MRGRAIATGLIVAAIAAPAGAGAARIATDNGDGERLCFSAKLWDGNDQRRPCSTIMRPREDASGYVSMGTRANPVRVECLLPNWREEPRHFAVACSKVAR